MTSTQTASQQEEIRALEAAEVEQVAGGVWSPVDVSQMPNRDIICGTAWIWDRLVGRPTPRA